MKKGNILLIPTTIPFGTLFDPAAGGFSVAYKRQEGMPTTTPGRDC